MATFDHRTGNVAFYTVTINSSVTGTFEVKASDNISFSSPMSPNTAQNPNPLTLTRTTGDGYVVPGSPSPGSDSPDASRRSSMATSPSVRMPPIRLAIRTPSSSCLRERRRRHRLPPGERQRAGHGDPDRRNGASITQISPGSGTGWPAPPTT